MPVLGDLRVLDFSRYIAGPYCASVLGDLGAEVVRIEPVGGGEDRRLIPVTDDGDGALFLQLNRNKKSLAVDAASSEGRQIVERLTCTADVVITNMPVGTLKRHGLDYETLRRLKPDIIATNLSAFGPKGPLGGRTGFDAVAQAVSGAAYLGGSPSRPSRAASSYVDYGTGLAGAVGTLAAIIHRLKTGEGQNVQASLLATAFTFINAAHIEAAVKGTDRRPYGNRSPNSAPSDFFPTLDGAIAVQVVGNPMFRRWARLMDRPELARDPRFDSDAARGQNGLALSRVMRKWTKTRTTAQAIEQLGRAGIPSGPVYSPHQAIGDPDIMESGVLGTVSQPGVGTALPIANLLVQLQSIGQSVRAPAPSAGQHTAQVLRAIGYSDEEIAHLARKGCVGAPELLHRESTEA
ncbi:CaiB/BaiF CoA transferase family protein [Rhodoligotrophos defluvii]|uniref:CaiB/BaiF CoA transferase family protein n=1 Tax=Rhodoligotrophos defluvii TaxID=2561934 RepID=UPI0010C9D74B|nr:CoA transferase [Rhodoligotrophos defluvii]